MVTNLRLISCRIDWFDLLAVQGILKSLLQHHSSKASILRLSTFSIVQLPHPYITTGKTIALTRQTFVGKVMSLLFNTPQYSHHSVDGFNDALGVACAFPNAIIHSFLHGFCTSTSHSDYTLLNTFL